MCPDGAGEHGDLLFEYGELRKEMLQNDQVTHQLLSYALGFAGVMGTVAFAQWSQNPALASAALLAVESVAIVAALQTLDRARNTFLKAAYVRVFLEERLPALGWESRVHALREQAPELGFGRFEGFSGQLWVYRIIIALAAVAGVVLAVGAPTGAGAGPQVWLAALSVVAAAVALRAVDRRHDRFVRHHAQTFGRRWCEIRGAGAATGRSGPDASLRPG